jgi:hypothetical protein
MNVIDNQIEQEEEYIERKEKRERERERERKRKERRILTFLLELGTDIIDDIKSTKIVLSPKPR